MALELHSAHLDQRLVGQYRVSDLWTEWLGSLARSGMLQRVSGGLKKSM